MFVTSEDLSKTYQTETAAAALPADETPNEQPPDTDKPPNDAQPCSSADTAVTIPDDHDEPVLRKAQTPAPPTGQPPRPKPVPEPSDGLLEKHLWVTSGATTWKASMDVTQPASWHSGCSVRLTLTRQTTLFGR